jgi:hypothetical protein
MVLAWAFASTAVVKAHTKKLTVCLVTHPYFEIKANVFISDAI